MSWFKDQDPKWTGLKTIFRQSRENMPATGRITRRSCSPTWLPSTPRRLAWDCATGSGQAAAELARYYECVIATDASAEQLALAVPHPQVDYRQRPPPKPPALSPATAGLLTAAIAVHWFDLDLFYPEVRRVLSAGGVLAVWGYHLPIIEPEIDRVVNDYYSKVLAGFWSERIHYVHERYQTLPFPFQELKPPDFEMQADWDLEQFLGFVGSWSAARKYEAERGRNPLNLIWDRLSGAWGSPDRKIHIRWPIYIRVGRGKPARPPPRSRRPALRLPRP